MRIENPFHEGELLVQQQAGETAKGEQNGKIIADSIPKGALKFIEQQSMVILGSVDEKQNIWASILFGAGFVRAIAPQTIEINRQQVFENPEDPFWRNIQQENRIAMLVIELETRRRLRINGAIAPTSANKLSLQMIESYPNCPKYIQRRQLSVDLSSGDRSFTVKSGAILTLQQQKLIESADTFFVASFHSTRGVDVSHRGGNSGFVQLISDRTLRIPDYNGNGMFNTLGNLIVNARAGLIFIDFNRSYTLQLIGEAEIIWDLEERDYPTGGTKRYWDFKIKSWLQTDLPQTFNQEFIDYSHHNPNI